MYKFALMVVHTGKIKTRNGKLEYINDIKELDALTFDTKKAAQKYVNNKLAWALKPVKIKVDCGKWFGKNTYYRFA